MLLQLQQERSVGKKTILLFILMLLSWVILFLLITLIHSSRDALRKAREAYLIERGQTLEPKGINKREEP